MPHIGTSFRLVSARLMSAEAKYIDAMKQIYEVDYGYRDVAERVEKSYSRAAAGS